MRLTGPAQQIVAPGLMFAATDSRHYTGITDKIFRFSPVRASSDDFEAASTAPTSASRSRAMPT
ncbi:hypothetical protein V1293_004718 [Bradyrhizobium sp. AZCC 1693]